MAALARKGIEIDGKRRRQRFAFARAHFSNLAVIEHHAADQLHVEVTHAEHAPGSFAHHGEGFRQKLVGRRSLGDAVAEFLRLSLEFGIRKRLDGRFKLIDLRHLALILLNQPIVAAAEDLG